MSLAAATHAAPLFKGLLTWIPGVQRAFYDRTASGGTRSAPYCYGVWLKHLCLLWRHGMRSTPQLMVELGPGGSLGTGLAALLCGVRRYAGLDVVRHASAASTAPVLRELVALFERRAPRPARGWPDYDACLDARLFPGPILAEERLAALLAPRRLATLGEAVARIDSPAQHPLLRYATSKAALGVAPGEADLVLSHVVLPVVADLEAFYADCARWLRPGGWMSHQIDFTSLGITREWNGHLRYGELAWRVVAGRRPFFVNRARLSTHLRLLHEHGFELVHAYRGTRLDGLPREALAPRWRALSDEDLQTYGAFLIARKRG